LIRWSKRQPVALAHGHVGCPSGWIPSRCLVRTAEVLRQVILEHRPEVCVVEALFYAQNLQTALVMGEARGAILLTAAEAGLQIYEMAARKVKLAIAGHGAAHKTAVAKMVQRLLQLPSPPQADAADALALALAYSQELHRVQLTVHRQI
jgi:crossover junction endodeoxyribonuclease RuvC